MPDWQKFVRERLSGLALDSAEREEVQAELAAHLEETCEEFRRQGMTKEEALHRTVSQVQDWQDLRRRIQLARKKENAMTNRVRQFWLPSLLTLFLSMSLLILVQFFGPNLSVIAQKSAWSLIAPVAVVYLPWLFSLPLVGAMGAYLSHRAGGSQRAMLSSTVFPVLPYLISFLIGLPLVVTSNHQIVHDVMFLALFVGLLAWVVAPGAALLTGGVLARELLSRRPEVRRTAGN